MIVFAGVALPELSVEGNALLGGLEPAVDGAGVELSGVLWSGLGVALESELVFGVPMSEPVVAPESGVVGVVLESGLLEFGVVVIVPEAFSSTALILSI